MSEELFKRTHELRHLHDIDGGWIAECHCGKEFGSSFAFLATWRQQEHRSKELKRGLQNPAQPP